MIGRRALGAYAATVVALGGVTALVSAIVLPQLGAMVGAHTSAPLEAINLDPLAVRSVVLAADGSVLTHLYREQNREPVALDEIPKVVTDTVLAVEDEDFYEHGGVNVRAALRALFTNIEAGDVRQGGSTITQQLVKNALLEPDQDLDRKLREAVLAVRLEDELSKEEILERYLNTVYLGNGAYGLQAAAELYFGKDVDQLDLADAVLLTGLIKNPVGYDPLVEPEAAEGRREEVVRRLVEVGQIDRAEADRVLATPLPTEIRRLVPRPNDYFVNEVIRLLLRDERLGETPNERYNALFKGGLTIKTTLDPRAQFTAIIAVKDTLPDSQGKFTAALVAVEPESGAVRALVGGPGFEQSKYNIATQGIGRQPGSAFKPFVLATALEGGISPRSRINGSSPCRFDNPSGTPDPYKVENFEGSRGGVGTIYDATKRSLNCAYVRLGIIAGLNRVAALTKRLGVSTPVEPNLSTPLGTPEIIPLEMAAAYATFANDGRYNEPYFVEEIRDREGDVLFRHDRNPRQVISADTARLVTDVLRGVITGGTGTRARFADGRPAAGKTGTTQDFGDAWFVGYTPQLATAVWMGSPVGNTIKMRNVGGVARVTGGTFPARIWQAFMGPVHKSLPIEQFRTPPPPERGVDLRLPGEPSLTRRTTTTTTTTEPEEEEAKKDEEEEEKKEEEAPTETTEPDTGNGNGNGNRRSD